MLSYAVLEGAAELKEREAIRFLRLLNQIIQAPLQGSQILLLRQVAAVGRTLRVQGVDLSELEGAHLDLRGTPEAIDHPHLPHRHIEAQVALA